MKLTTKDIPPEVQRVWAIQMSWKMFGIGVGSKLYNDCIDTMRKYPEWFPKEIEALNKIKKQSS